MLFVIDTSANTAGASIFDAIFEFSYLSFKWSISAYLIFTLFKTGSNPVNSIIAFSIVYFREQLFSCYDFKTQIQQRCHCRKKFNFIFHSRFEVVNWAEFRHTFFVCNAQALQKLVRVHYICTGIRKVHPQNVRFQNVRFQNVWFQNFRLQNVRFTKRQVYKTSGFKTYGFKTSSF